jgi:hypothetical protein
VHPVLVQRTLTERTPGGFLVDEDDALAEGTIGLAHVGTALQVL